MGSTPDANPKSSGEPFLRLGSVASGRRLGWLGGGLSVVAVLLWLTDVSGVGLPRPLSRAIVLVWLLSLAALLVRWLQRSWYRDGARWQGLLLPGLLLVSLVVRLVGLGWEAGAGYYRDEGIYRAAAVLINEGELLPESFIYGHLLYYLAAFALWLQSLFPELVAGIGRTVFRAGSDEQVISIVLRSVSATLGALTTLPVFLIARRLAGTLAAITAALLIIFSMLYNEVTHLLISDVPSAFFATLCLLFVARLIDREKRSDYLWAGICAGLAAASKYPAGVVAIGIVAAWLRWRISERRWSWDLLWAGLVSIATVLAVMPAFLAYWGDAFSNEGRDIFFGFRQYGRGGW
ncbi:MAG: glycosyltransferase family 39 protein, partial [Acidobacteria bacterium]|nr:glycosyltransferase family 39 protein [Acidobacteriota bacterium]